MKFHPPVCPKCGSHARSIVEGVLYDSAIRFVEETCIECEAALGQPHEEDCTSLLNEGAPPLVTRDDIPDDAGTYEAVDEESSMCWDTSEPWVEDGYATVTCEKGHSFPVELDTEDEDDGTRVEADERRATEYDP